MTPAHVISMIVLRVLLAAVVYALVAFLMVPRLERLLRARDVADRAALRARMATFRAGAGDVPSDGGDRA